MAITYIEIDTDQLKRDTQELLENKQKAESVLNEMVHEIEELNTMWSGRANMAFRSQFGKDVQLMQELLGKMQKLGECMEFAAEEYIRCESEVKTLVDSIKI